MMSLPTRSQGKSKSQSENRHATSDLASQLAVTRAELAALQDRYDALRVDRDRLAQTLEEKMKKWKRFKRWVFTMKANVPSEAECDKGLGVSRAGSSTPALQQQLAVKMLETPLTPKSAKLSPAKSGSSRRSPLSPNKYILNTSRKVLVSAGGSPSARRFKRPRDENEDTFVEEMSQTQEDSQALTFWQPSTPSQRERVRKLSLSPCAPTPQRPAVLHSPPPTKRPRRSAEPVLGSASAPPIHISRYKRERGGAPEPQALNAEFEIEPAANAGMPFAFDEVVRGRRHRHGLNAGECEECRGWYTAVGPLPPRLQAPRWSSPSRPSSPTLVASEPASSGVGDGDSEISRSYTAGVNAHRQAVSRHRAQWERPPTPPGYWEIGFPDTQAVEKINEQAADMHRQKRAAVAKEAKEAGGRYRRRA
ncbi:hypothetical protein BJV74DRAFT_863381 [Russula compacta]|nr:hypothetical protein BJV74DRAFT_863381 [Russula compacta]